MNYSNKSKKPVICKFVIITSFIELCQVFPLFIKLNF